MEEANEPARESAACPQGQDDRNSDLCAQWKAADAAADSAYWTSGTFWIGIVGLVLGAVTMGAAIAAAVFARRAAVATEETVGIAREASIGANEALATASRNADAAADQVRISERTAHRQLRPYVHFAGAPMISDERGRRILSVSMKNFGRTPAKHCDVFVTRVMAPYPIPPETVFEAKYLEASEQVIPPGASYEVIAPLPTGARRSIANGEKCWTVTVTINYKLMDETNHVIEEAVTATAILNAQDIELGFGHNLLPRDFEKPEDS
jgi:hypothetical protein